MSPLFEEAEARLEEAREAGVGGCLVPSYGPDEWDRQDSLLRFPGVTNALGIHPWCVPGRGDLSARLDEAFGEYPARWGERLRAVGEFGLDRSSSEFKDCFEVQTELFRSHMRWAEKLGLPVIVHVVGAHGAALELFQEKGPTRGVLHSYSGSPEMVARYAECGLAFSFSGNLLSSGKARESLKVVAPDRLLFETDAPEGPELGRAGPAALLKVIEVAAEILEKSESWCRDLHRENCRRIFGLGEIPRAE